MITEIHPIKKFIPLSFFGIILGLVGIGDCWRVAVKIWGLPSYIGESIMLLAVIIWGILLLNYIIKWIFSPNEALTELNHPIQSCFAGLIGVSTLLIAVAVEPYFINLSNVFFIAGTIIQLAYGVYFTGLSFKGERDYNTITAAIYLPRVAANLVNSFVAGYLGHPGLSVIFLGIGVFSWISLESVVTNRLLLKSSLPEAQRPTMGILLAPPAVGCVAYLFLNGKAGPAPDIFAKALFGYGLFMLLNLIRLIPWITKQPFSASYWAFSFGITAIALVSMIFVMRGLNGSIQWMAKGLFIFANCCIFILVIRSVHLLFSKKLLPPPLPHLIK